eukprot:1409103-Prymnesium_polylepis.2
MSPRRVSEAENERGSVALGRTWATGRPSLSHECRRLRRTFAGRARAIGIWGGDDPPHAALCIICDRELEQNRHVELR